MKSKARLSSCTCPRAHDSKSGNRNFQKGYEALFSGNGPLSLTLLITRRQNGFQVKRVGRQVPKQMKKLRGEAAVRSMQGMVNCSLVMHRLLNGKPVSFHRVSRIDTTHVVGCHEPKSLFPLGLDSVTPTRITLDYPGVNELQKFRAFNTFANSLSRPIIPLLLQQLILPKKQPSATKKNK